MEMTRERVRPSHLHALSELCPLCSGRGRVLSKDTMATKIERWFRRARADRTHRKFHLVINPLLAASMSDNGVNRIDRLMKTHKFQVNLVRDTTVPMEEYKVFDAETNQEITDKYKV